MQTKTADQVENRLKEADFPAKVIPSVIREIESFPPEAEGLFAFWFDKDYLGNDAFDLLGITPKVIREKFHGITDVGILIMYSHLVKTVRKEFATLCLQAGIEERIAKVERNLGKVMIGRSNKVSGESMPRS